MRAGLLRIRAEIQQPTKSRGANGEELTTWATVATRFCSVMGAQGKEGETAGLEVRATQRFTIRLRYESVLAALSPEWRLLVGSVAYRILAVDNVSMRNREFELDCVTDV